jgi:hypothetical protein
VVLSLDAVEIDARLVNPVSNYLILKIDSITRSLALWRKLGNLT